jgi:hypothetical protein
MDLVKILAKKSKTLHLDHSCHIEGDIMQNHEQKKKSEKPRFYGQNKLFFENPALHSPWVVSATWLHVGVP